MVDTNLDLNIDINTVPDLPFHALNNTIYNCIIKKPALAIKSFTSCAFHTVCKNYAMGDYP